MKKLSLAVAAALLFTTGASFAASLSISPAVATATPGAGNPTTPASIAVQWDNSGLAAGEGDSIDAQVFFDSTKFTVNVTGDCAPGAAGEIIIAAVQLQSNTIPSGAVCNMTFTTTAGAVDGNAVALDLANTSVGNNGAPLAQQPAATDGVINVAVAAANPPTINFAPTTVNLATGNVGSQSPASVIAVTATGGAAPDVGSYNCGAQPAGFQVTNLANASIAVGSDPADMNATCTLGAAPQQAVLNCTRTGGAAVQITLNCPAGQAVAPVITPTPANGTALTCNGQPGSTQTTQVTLQNTGNAAATGVSCSTTGAGFSIQAQPTGTINAGASSSVVAACTVPAEGATITGTLNCTSGNAGSLSYPLSSLGQAAPVGSNLATIPSTSLWAKIGLIGLLAALGALVVGFRRHN